MLNKMEVCLEEGQIGSGMNGSVKGGQYDAGRQNQHWEYYKVNDPGIYMGGQYDAVMQNRTGRTIK